ncbi:unnamed protein product [Paramecium sonneborni]|uniref:Uncharacterized protein n=1 Tax=Paramecium sonneborni TaxID=65129 RepID=A0A8S1M530_9CILI|nr:unnamed protein product [Paramecium sonneborni]
MHRQVQKWIGIVLSIFLNQGDQQFLDQMEQLQNPNLKLLNRSKRPKQHILKKRERDLLKQYYEQILQNQQISYKQNMKYTFLLQEQDYV